MSWIDSVPEAEATGLFSSVYEESQAKFGRVINLVKIQSLRPEAMAIGREFYRHLMGLSGGLSRLLIATVVSKVNGCLY